MKLVWVIVLLLCSVIASAQSWNGKQCAVVLTYDDGLAVHLTHAVPALDSAGLKGTFYISDYTKLLRSQIPEWRKAAANGHELANHTMHHPCEGGRAGREFVRPENDMKNYTVRRMTDEILSLNNLLHEIDGNSERTFAYPCGDQKILDSFYLDPIKNKFLAARGVMSGFPTSASQINWFDVNCYSVAGESGDDLVNVIREAEKTGALVVFLFHGVGGGHALNVSLDAHRQLLQYLQKSKNKIWNPTMLELAKFGKKENLATYPVVLPAPQPSF